MNRNESLINSGLVNTGPDAHGTAFQVQLVTTLDAFSRAFR
jgi:hypothetical protein